MRALPFAILLAALVVASVTAAAGRVTVTTSHNTKLNASILVTQGGMTLYHLTSETGAKITCTGSCATIWPPLLVARGSKPLAGNGIGKNKLGTIKRPDGRSQITYAGLALYRYSGDTKAGDIKGEGFQHVWYAIGPPGQLVKSSSRGGYGGGYGR
jgi:predicted lipoprotein with Yx(FWY)xxD motif